MLRDQFPLNIRDPRAKDKLIMEAQNNPRLLTFDRAVSIVKTCDSLNVRKDEEEMEVDLLKKQQIKKKPCSYCGQTHLPRQCPAYGKLCAKCRKRSHFAAVCKMKHNVNSLSEHQAESESSGAQGEDEECI